MSINKETNMEKLESARFQMSLDANMATKAKNLGLMGAGGGLILLFASVVFFIKRK